MKLTTEPIGTLKAMEEVAVEDLRDNACLLGSRPNKKDHTLKM